MPGSHTAEYGAVDPVLVGVLLGHGGSDVGEARPRMSKERWANAALRALAEDGVSAVAVEPLARRLGVTKGSFYWHYDSRDALLEAAMQRWEHNNARALGVYESDLPDPRERLKALFQAAFEPSALGGLIVHLAADREHPAVAPVLARVTRERIAYLSRIYAGIGLAEGAAHHQALLAYTAYIGLFQLMATTPDAVPEGEALLDYIAHMVDALVP